MTRFLHVANGTSTTRRLAEAGVPGAFSIWADPLHEGPVPGGIDDDALIEVRRRYLAGSKAAEDPVNDMHAWRRVIADHNAYDELVLWYEHDLFDQLNLIQLLTLIRESLPARQNAGAERPRPTPTAPIVSLVCIDAFPGRPQFKGLGELTPHELAPLLDTRVRVSDGQYDVARRGWEAFREPTPLALDALRRGDTTALPFLAAALERFLQEYPWTTDGLSRSERRLLQLADERTRTIGAAFGPMSDGERAYYVSDLSLLALAESLSDASPPLLTLSGTPEAGPAAFTRVAGLTDHGRRVLAGERDRVATCGIDTWLGGVHLEGRSVPWRWDPDTKTIVAAS